jgi:hypothetical protein
MLSTFFCSQHMESHHQIASDLPNLHVLVVDEDEAARSACVEIAGSLGYKAEGVARLNKVSSTLGRFPTDILLIDLPKRAIPAWKRLRRFTLFFRGFRLLRWHL